MKRNKIKGIAGRQTKNVDNITSEPKVASTIMTSSHDVDYEVHSAAEDNETDDESDIS
jgi:hypothetical protein